MARTQELLDMIPKEPFEYHHDKRVFLIGERCVAIAEAAENVWLLGADSEVSSNISTSDMVIATTSLGPIAYPRFGKWVEQSFSRAVGKETEGVMIDVFGALRPDLSSASLKSDPYSHLGFRVGAIRLERGHVDLNVLGNCACCAPSVDGIFGEEVWRDGFARYDLHNVDTPAQEVSILAGLGHLAYIARMSSGEGSIQ